jgi:hypothetical protein
MEIKVTVPADSLSLVADSVAKVNKKLAKVGSPSITAHSGEVKLESRHGRYVEVVEITISGPSIVLNGWKFVAIVTPLVTDSGEVMGFATTVPGESIKRDLVSGNPFACEHCNQNRRRNTTFIVRNSDGTEKQVGSACMGDFLNNSATVGASAVTAAISALGRLTSECESFGNTRAVYSDSLVNILALTVAVIKARGWVPRKDKDIKLPTANIVRDCLNNITGAPLTHSEIADFWSNADFEKARAIISDLGVHFDSLEENGSGNDYERNLMAIFQVGAANSRTLGLACSMVNYHTRVMTPKGASNAKPSDYVGDVGARVKGLAVKVLGVHFTGEMSIVNLVDNDSNLITWFTGNVPVEAGRAYKMTATVRRHDFYKGSKVTVVNRPVFE